VKHRFSAFQTEIKSLVKDEKCNGFKIMFCPLVKMYDATLGRPALLPFFSGMQAKSKTSNFVLDCGQTPSHLYAVFCPI
jgi:hypothetical protein